MKHLRWPRYLLLIAVVLGFAKSFVSLRRFDESSESPQVRPALLYIDGQIEKAEGGIPRVAR